MYLVIYRLFIYGSEQVKKRKGRSFCSGPFRHRIIDRTNAFSGFHSVQCFDVPVCYLFLSSGDSQQSEICRDCLAAAVCPFLSEFIPYEFVRVSSVQQFRLSYQYHKQFLKSSVSVQPYLSERCVSCLPVSEAHCISSFVVQ